MAIFNNKSAKSQEVEFSPTFTPLELMSAFLSDGMSANQKKFLTLYLTVPELQAIINYKARVFSGMHIISEDSEGNEKKIPQIGLLNKPNPLQNFKEFASQYYILRSIFGNEFIHPVYGGDRTKTQALWNLPAMNAEIIPVSNQLIPFNMTKVEELIKEYKFWYKGQKIIYQPDEVIHFNDNQVQFTDNKILLGDSKIRPLTQACENIKNAYEARGVIIYNSALGILSNETTDADGTADIAVEDKKQLQEGYKGGYGLSKHKNQIILTNAALKWQSMAIDIGKLKLFEEVDSDFRTIANAYSFPPKLLQVKAGNSLSESDNDVALRQLYQEAVIPEADEWLLGLSDWMGLDNKLKSDWSHIAVLQIDKERASKSLNWAATGLSKAKESGLIEDAEAKETFKKFLP